MTPNTLKQDYWPGYLDAMVNLMLYLLLLVGAFALGLTTLSLHSMQQQRQLSFVGVPSEGLVARMELSERERNELATKLASLDVDAIVQRREQLDRERQQETENLAKQRSQDDQEKIVNKGRPSSSNVSTKEQRTTQEIELDLKKIELSKKLAIVDKEYSELLGQLEGEQLRVAQSLARKPVEVVTDIRVLSRGAGSATHDAVGGAVDLFGMAPRFVWEFDINQFAWAENRPPSSDFSEAERAMGWSLVVYVDLKNSRIGRESFARVNSVREVLVKQGFARERIKVEVRSIDAASSRDERIFRTVYMIQNNQIN